MDPTKVDQVKNWKTPTNKSLLSSFIGSVGYLAPGCLNVWIPMQRLSKLAAPTTPWSWNETDQRAFDLVKKSVHDWRNVCRQAIDYSLVGAPINLVTDACLTGGSGVVSQGDNYLDANIIVFWSGKFNSAQQNYPVHEQELLAIVESLKRFRHLLQGMKFRVYTDHKGLEWIATQKKLSPRQARWLEEISDFDFEIVHVPGVQNQLADALSRMYSDEPQGTVRAASEYASVEPENTPSKLILGLISAPCYTAGPIFLGAASSKRGAKARKAFLNVKRVVLKVSDPLVPLEGESNGQLSKNLIAAFENASLSNKDTVEVESAELTDDMVTAEVLAEKPEHVSSDCSTDELRDSDTAAREILSESPVSLTEVLDSGDPTLDIHGRLVGRYTEDPLFKLVLEKPRSYKNFEISNGLIFLKDRDSRVLCIPDIKIGSRCI